MISQSQSVPCIALQAGDENTYRAITKKVFLLLLFLFFIVAGALEWYFTRYSPLVGVQSLN